MRNKHIAVLATLILLTGATMGASYQWNGENEETWDLQKTTASNSLDINVDSITDNEVCEFLKENNQESFNNLCEEIESTELNWADVSQIITEAQDSDLNDKWVKISKLITCVENQGTPADITQCDESSELTQAANLIQSSNQDDTSSDDSNEETDETSSNEDNTGESVDEPIEKIQYIDKNGEPLKKDTEDGSEVVEITEEGETVTYGMYDGSLEGEFDYVGTAADYDVDIKVTNEISRDTVYDPIEGLSTQAPSDRYTYLASGECTTFWVKATSEDGASLEGTFRFYPNAPDDFESCDNVGDNEEDNSGDE